MSGPYRQVQGYLLAPPRTEGESDWASSLRAVFGAKELSEYRIASSVCLPVEPVVGGQSSMWCRV